MNTILRIKGMHCDSCRSLIEEVVQGDENVQKCIVDVEKGIATITHNDKLNLQVLKDEINSLGEFKVE